MSTIAELFGMKRPVLGPAYGLEVEVEGMPELASRVADADAHKAVLTATWAAIRDGSLRNHGVELVCRRPVSYSDLPKALGELSAILSGEPAVFSVRTSTHVHMNVQDMTPEQVLCLVLLAAGVEPLLQEMVAPERRMNLFCLPMHVCRTFQNCVVSAYVERKSGGFSYLSEVGKYSSVNTGRLPDLGTIEFRSLHGAVDVQHVHKWIQVLNNLRNMALNMQDVGDLFPILTLPEHALRDAVFSGVEFRRQPGDAYRTLADCCAASMAVASECKTTNRPPNPVDVLVQYREVQSDIDLVRAQALDMPPRGASLRAFGGYSVPDIAVLRMVLRTAPIGTIAFDVLRVAQNTVMFFAYQEGVKKFVLTVSLPPEEKPVELPVVTISLEV